MMLFMSKLLVWYAAHPPPRLSFFFQAQAISHYNTTNFNDKPVLHKYNSNTFYHSLEITQI